MSFFGLARSNVSLITTPDQNYSHINSCLYQLSSAFILDLWAARWIKTISLVQTVVYRLSSTLTLQFLLSARRVEITFMQTLVYINFHQFSSSIYKQQGELKQLASFKLLSISTLTNSAHPSVFIVGKESQNNFHTNSCLYQISSAFILDLWATKRVKHCYIVSYKLLSTNSYHNYFIHLRTHLHVYQNKTLFFLLLERKTSREATSKET